MVSIRCVRTQNLLNIGTKIDTYGNVLALLTILLGFPPARSPIFVQAITNPFLLLIIDEGRWTIKCRPSSFVCATRVEFADWQDLELGRRAAEAPPHQVGHYRGQRQERRPDR